MKQTQGERVLGRLREAGGGWVNGRVFNSEMMISQFHTRIHELQRKGHRIEASGFTDEYGFKSYRLAPEAPPSCCGSLPIFGEHARDCAINRRQKHGDTLFAAAHRGA